MKIKLVCLSFISTMIIAGAFAFEPTVTNATFGVQPSPTPKKKPKSKPKKPEGWFDETSLGTASLERGANTAPRSNSNTSVPNNEPGALANVKPRVPHVAVGDVNGDPRDARRKSRKHRRHHH